MVSLTQYATTDIVVGVFINDMTKDFSLRRAMPCAGNTAAGWGKVENEAYLRPIVRWPFLSGFSRAE